MAVHQDPDVVLPVDAERIDPWEFDDDGGRFRYFEGQQRGDLVPVQIGGFQRGDGTLYELTVNVDADGPLDAEAAEELLGGLATALADLRRLAQYRP